MIKAISKWPNGDGWDGEGDGWTAEVSAPKTGGPVRVRIDDEDGDPWRYGFFRTGTDPSAAIRTTLAAGIIDGNWIAGHARSAPKLVSDDGPFRCESCGLPGQFEENPGDPCSICFKPETLGPEGFQPKTEGT